jgi:O-acetyl-ADP-ribose deacetylase (regulator of RNase III)
MPLTIIKEDITKLKVTAIVNAANEQLAPGGGICGAIFQGAGKLLKKDCESIGHCDTGDAIITFAYKLPPTYVIHAVGPIWKGGNDNEPKLLYSTYQRAMELADTHDCKTVAFPLISSGAYGYPHDLAFHVAVASIGDYLLVHREIDVRLSVFPDKIGLPPERKEELTKWLTKGPGTESFTKKSEVKESKPGFIDKVKSLLGSRTYDEAVLAKRANLKEADVSVITKGEVNEFNIPSKGFVLSLAIAFGLDLKETQKLLNVAGYSFDPTSTTDLIVVYFFEKNIYDVFFISEALYAFGEPFLNN